MYKLIYRRTTAVLRRLTGETKIKNRSVDFMFLEDASMSGKTDAVEDDQTSSRRSTRSSSKVNMHSIAHVM